MKLTKLLQSCTKLFSRILYCGFLCCSYSV
nr:MAG TPA: hypothetical protein [Caudoviricetes sp.]